jgi:hypothetical protein
MVRLPFSGVVGANLARKLQDSWSLHFGGGRSRFFKAVLFAVLVFGAIHPCGAAIPDPYYVNVSWDDHTVHGIETLLGEGFTIPYEVDVFDCSEMSAYVEWLLTCHGFDAGFCVDGTGPWMVPPGYPYNVHMWVAVRLWNDTTGAYEGLVYIETTSNPMKIIKFADPEWSKYARPQENMFLGMKNYFSLPDMLAGITPNEGDNNTPFFTEDEFYWWQFGSDLIKKPVPHKEITTGNVITFRSSLVEVPPKKSVTFKTT